MKTIILFIVIFISNLGFAQIDWKEFKKSEPALLATVNTFLAENGGSSYQSDPILGKAAQLQADYLISQPLSTTQKSGKNKTVEKRIKTVKGDFDDAFQLVVEIPSEGKQGRKELEPKICAILLQELRLQSDDLSILRYNEVGFGWSKQKKGANYVLSVVFAHRKTNIEGQLSKNAFSLQKGPENCANLLEIQRITILTHCIYIEGNEVKLDYRNKERLKLLFPNPKDGIAIDIMSESQFPCNSANELDQSLLYDGVLLKPIYRDQLFNSNTSEGDFRLKTVLGVIPEELLDEPILPNLIYIRNGQACRYSILHYIDGEPYGLAPIEPAVDEHFSPLRSQGSIRTIKSTFEFEQGETVPKGIIPSAIPKDSIMAIEVISFSSIEGTELINQALHETRAKEMLNLAERKVGRCNCVKKTTVAENWEQCYLQLEMLGLDSIAKLPKDSIRLYVLRDKSHNWDSLLNKQRVSTLIFHIRGTRDSLTQREDFLNMNVRTALLEGNTRQANQAMLKMYRENLPTSLLMEPGIINRLMVDTALVQNASALLTNHFNPKDIRILGFVRNWLRDPSQLSEFSKRNLIHLYNLSTYTLLDKEWDIKTNVYLKLLDPRKLDDFFADRKVSSVYDLNYYLTRLSYHELSGDYDAIDPCFKKIEAYFQEQQLNLEEEVKLARFFNWWSRPDLSISLLQKRMDGEDFTGEAAYLLAETLVGYTYRFDQKDIQKAAQRAYELDPIHWCQLVNFDFQIYRDAKLKQLYCIPCSEYK